MADNSASVLEMLTSVPVRREADPLPYRIQTIAEKGLGVVATRKIRRYEIVVTDVAGVLADYELSETVDRRVFAPLLTRGMEQLPDPQTMAFGLAQSVADPEVQVSEDIMQTNAYGFLFASVQQKALFPKISVCGPFFLAYRFFPASALSALFHGHFHADGLRLTI